MTKISTSNHLVWEEETLLEKYANEDDLVELANVFVAASRPRNPHLFL